MTKTNDDQKKISREDVVKKMEELDSAFNDSAKDATNKLKVVAVVAVVGIALIAFASGRRRALRPKTLVSFTKLK